jgi:hypothetical protein
MSAPDQEEQFAVRTERTRRKVQHSQVVPFGMGKRIALQWTSLGEEVAVVAPMMVKGCQDEMEE